MEYEMETSQAPGPAATGTTEVRDAVLTLSGGHSVAYTDLGPPAGPVVVYCHGAPASRLDMVPFRDAFAALGVRVVSADRPGFGGSTPRPGRSLVDWPAQVALLADHLGVQRFAVLGASAGASYALACAALLSDRVVSVGVVCGVTDFGWPGAREGYPAGEVELMGTGSEAAATAWCEARYGTDGSRIMDADFGDQVPADQAFLANPELAAGLATTVGEACRQGVGGYAQDVLILGQAWPFDPAAIVAPVELLHGEDDTMVPLAHARHTADVVPGAKLVTRPGHGHISILAEIPRLAAGLVAPLR
jgi:pimeloyl-ACP methyl ester carboxylesterase